MEDRLIKEMIESDIPELIEVFKLAYRDMDVPTDEQQWFEGDLRSSFDSKEREELSFYKIEVDDQIVSFAALQSLGFTRNVWALRWGTTQPAYQGQGLMSQLTDYRIQEAEKLSDTIGSIHLTARRPGIYLKRGFKVLYERGPQNKAAYLMKIINA